MNDKAIQDKKDSTSEPGSTATHEPPAYGEDLAAPSTLPTNPPSTGPYKGMTPSEQAEAERVEAQAKQDKRLKEEEADAKKADAESRKAHDEGAEADTKKA